MYHLTDLTGAGATETVEQRLLRLECSLAGSNRLKSLEIAHPLVDDKTFAILANAIRVRRKKTIVLPSHHFEGLSRGRGWARKGRGDSAEWGERVDDGYSVGPGRWSVGATDGFSRRDETTWTVAHITVGQEIWTIAS